MSQRLEKDMETSRILHERARLLARPPERSAISGSLLEVLEFRLAQERFAIETRHVDEVHPLRELTPLPCTPAFIRGIVNVRGRILPVLDLKKFFELPDKGLTDLHRIILVRGQGLELGLLADVALGVRSIEAGRLQPPLPTLTGIRAQYLKGLTEEPVAVLDLDRILGDPAISVHEEVQP